MNYADLKLVSCRWWLRGNGAPHAAGCASTIFDSCDRGLPSDVVMEDPSLKLGVRPPA